MQYEQYATKLKRNSSRILTSNLNFKVIVLVNQTFKLVRRIEAVTETVLPGKK